MCLFIGKQLIRPSAGRQFRASDNLIMFLAVYNAANSPETGKPLVRVTVRLMKDGQPATKPFDYVLTEIQNQPVPHLKFAEYLRLANLAPGRYQAIDRNERHGHAKVHETRSIVRDRALIQ